MKPIHIFKAGRQTDIHGETVDFTESHLASTAAAYNVGKHEAPIVIGHPEQDAPAYGWITQLRLDGGDLYAVPDQLDASFSEMVQQGRFKKVSASFYPPTSPNNPVPGVYSLRHVGFLGAQPPAVKGLQPIQFAEATDALTVELEFAEDSISSPDSFLKWLTAGMKRYFNFTESPPTPAANTDVPLTPDSSVEPVEPINPLTDASLHKPTEDALVTPEQIAALQAENTRLKTAAEARQAADAKAKADADHQANVDFAENLIKDAKLVPADKLLVVALLDAAQPATGQALNFGEGTQSKPLRDALKERLSSAPAHSLLFAELAVIGPGKSAVNFAAPVGTAVDAEGLARHRDILAYAEANKTTYETAAMALGG